jgi:hypothetical protein
MPAGCDNRRQEACLYRVPSFEYTRRLLPGTPANIGH